LRTSSASGSRTYAIVELAPNEKLVMTAAMKRANRKDLVRLKKLLESSEAL
jgi:hypothetical protein